MIKKILHTSNLALRFYTHSGWSLEELESLVDKETSNPRGIDEGYFHFQDDTSRPYYIPRVGVNMKVKELAGKVSEIKKAFDDYPSETIEECIKRFGW